MKYHYTAEVKELLGDLHTPVSVYMRVRDSFAQSALMESSDYHGGENARSFIGFEPIASVAVSHGMAICNYPDGRTTGHAVGADYTTADAINEFLASFTIDGAEAHCGLFGYTSFNAVRYFEDIAIKDETQPVNDAPDVLYVLFKGLVVFDHFNNKMHIVSLRGEADQKSGIRKIEKMLARTDIQAYGFHPVG